VAAEKANWPISAEARRQSSLVGGGGARAEIPATPIDENGRINRPETRGGRPTQTLPPGTMRIPLGKQPIMEGATDGRPKAPAVPQYEPYRPAAAAALPAAPDWRPPPPSGVAPARSPAPGPAPVVPPSPAPPPSAAPASPPSQHGAHRFSSVFGTRRR
jgi:hypothetical protein